MLYCKDIVAVMYRVTIQVVPNLPLTSKQKFHFTLMPMYRVTKQAVPNLPLASNHKFHFGLAWPVQAKAELLF